MVFNSPFPFLFRFCFVSVWCLTNREDSINKALLADEISDEK